MSKSVNLALIFLVGAVLIEVCKAQNGTCPPQLVNASAIPDLDILRLNGSRWYVQDIFVRTQENVHELNFNCLWELFMAWESSGDYLSAGLADFYNTLSGASRMNVSVAYYEPDAPGVWTLYDGSYYRYLTTFTHTDYETYGVMHWCPLENPHHAYERILTFTPTPTPTGSVLAELKEKVASLGFPTEYVIHVDHHPDCIYPDSSALAAAGKLSLIK